MAVTIVHLDASMGLLGAQLTNAFKSIIGAVLHGEIRTVLQECFELLAFVFPAVSLDGLMQVMESCNQGPASKQGGDLCPSEETCLAPCLPHLGSQRRQLGGRWYRMPAGWKPLSTEMNQLFL